MRRTPQPCTNPTQTQLIVIVHHGVYPVRTASIDPSRLKMFSDSDAHAYEYEYNTKVFTPTTSVLAYSCLNAFIGSTRDALLAGI